ncbi:(4-(4-[2-(gamma-L-glutamylamino)ethyl]phenoxymethyl)furan-2-yl)methanamine synthase [Methylophilaceae bacterium]|nr:(4-(4-[2-(gamma-L-glutamylamino)ethyl]phenoxymethyl)furan-2-yl)methanamine synthase [Methylophilaceae bacterium]
MSSNKLNVIGWDVGGAHLKAVLIDAEDRVLDAVQLACPLWQGIDKLDAALGQVLALFGDAAADHAVTMTGELADIFINRRDGVEKISRHLHDRLGGRARFYAAGDGFVEFSRVPGLHSRIASANWHASASYAARKLGQGLFIDIGSTTTDIVILSGGVPGNRGFSDAERMRADELVYTGVVRTPLMALAHAVAFNGHVYRVAAEHFATTADIYRITGELMETEDMSATADGAEKSRSASMRRLARMLGHDREDAMDASWLELANTFKAQQLRHLESAISALLARGQLDAQAPMIAAGAGSFLAEELARRFNRDLIRVEDLVSADSEEARHWAGVCFPAYAVACMMS